MCRAPCSLDDGHGVEQHEGGHPVVLEIGGHGDRGHVGLVLDEHEPPVADDAAGRTGPPGSERPLRSDSSDVKIPTLQGSGNTWRSMTMTVAQVPAAHGR